MNATFAMPSAGDVEREHLRLESITKRFGNFTAVNDVSVAVPQRSFFALLGPSGCGKTTVLRMIAGFDQPTAGRILLSGVDIAGVKPYRRPVNTVFQSYALFPHLTIAENVAFGLRRRGIKDYAGPVRDMLALVELSNHASMRPHQLSGGQQQRVALARALINHPEVLLLDEPLGALDLKLRRQMQIELKRIQTEVGLTFIHVTHDQEEAMTMADTIAVMNRGVIEQMGAPADLYENPRTTFVANFLGQSNLIDAHVVLSDASNLIVDVHGTKIVVDRSRAAVTGGQVWLGIRPEKLSVRGPGLADWSPGAAGRSPGASAPGTSPAVNTLTGGVISDISFVGVSTQYLVRMPWGQTITVFEQNTGERPALTPGAGVSMTWAASHAFVLDHAQDALDGVDREGGKA
jgi:spermidine/putrescine transport system ATP-binding protein